MKNVFDLAWKSAQGNLIEIGCYKDLLYYILERFPEAIELTEAYIKDQLQDRYNALIEQNISSQTNIHSFLSTLIRDTKKKIQ